VNVFELDEALIGDYERFARSFTLIRAPDIRTHVEALYAGDRFWPEPLISINPRFERGHQLISWPVSGPFMKLQSKYSALMANHYRYIGIRPRLLQRQPRDRASSLRPELVRANRYAFLFQ
jgi:hypothetical protein